MQALAILDINAVCSPLVAHWSHVSRQFFFVTSLDKSGDFITLHGRRESGGRRRLALH